MDLATVLRLQETAFADGQGLDRPESKPIAQPPMALRATPRMIAGIMHIAGRTSDEVAEFMKHYPDPNEMRVWRA